MSTVEIDVVHLGLYASNIRPRASEIYTGTISQSGEASQISEIAHSQPAATNPALESHHISAK